MNDLIDQQYAQYKQLFNDHQYVFIKNFLSKELATFIFNYGVMRHNRARFFIENNWPFYRMDDGVLSDNCVDNSYCCYGDPVMETILALGLKSMERITDKTLVAQYSYWRLYKQGDALHRHTDRASCEFSTTMCLGYDITSQNKGWPIYIGEPGSPGKAVTMQAGDMLVYRGDLLEHWREPFEGQYMAQVFLHYNDANGPYGQQQFDGRPMLGLPFNFAQRDVKNGNDDAK